MMGAQDTGVVIPQTGMSAAKIRASIASVIRDVIPEGRTGAVVGLYEAATDTTHLLVAQKVGEHFEFVGDFLKDGKHISGKVMVGASW